jgi:hypothetical protein
VELEGARLVHSADPSSPPARIPGDTAGRMLVGSARSCSGSGVWIPSLARRAPAFRERVTAPRSRVGREQRRRG